MPLLLCFIGLAVWLIFFDGWHSKLRYHFEYGVPFDQVTEDKQPHNCDWRTAPMGSKNCHYEAEVTRVQTAVSTEGKPIVSYDEGKTWFLNNLSPPVKPSVNLHWKKIED
jgi:hypothetical protein